MLKNKIKFLLSIVALGSVLLTGCKKYLDINQNPNLPLSSSVGLQLTTSELYIGNALGDRIFPIVNVWSQYYTGGPGVALGDWDRNAMNTSDGNSAFNNMYRSMTNLDYIIKRGSATDSLYYAMAEILKAYNFQVVADLFGDVPFTDALKGDIADGFVVAPKYDDAATVVYPGIEALLLDAVRILNEYDAHPNGTYTVPGEEDLIFNGEMYKWLQFGNSLLLKLYIREGSAASQAKFATLYNDFIVPTGYYIGTNEDMAKIPYPGGPQGSNPFWNSSNSSIGNYFVGSKTTIDYLLGTSDPRIDAFFEASGTGAHLGLKQGDVENWSPPTSFSTPNGAADNVDGGLIFGPAKPVILMSAWEADLILAEAASRGWITEDVAALYGGAVNASFDYLEVAGADAYLLAGGALNTSTPAAELKSIALQKWVSMNGLQPVESWIETRRVDNAANPIFASPGGIFVSPTQNELTGGQFPSILYYPQTEQDLNPNAPPQNVLTGKVFWDN